MQLCKACGQTDPALFYVSNKRKCKKCCTATSKQRYHNLLPIAKAEYKARAGRWQDDNMLLYRWRSALSRAAARNIEFSITEQDVSTLWKEQNGICFYTGLPMVMVRDNNRFSVSIERKDPSVGYCVGNVVLCCSAVNIMKNDLPTGEFVELVKALYNHIDAWE